VWCVLSTTTIEPGNVPLSSVLDNQVCESGAQEPITERPAHQALRANEGVVRQLEHQGVEVMTALNTEDAVSRYDPAVHQLVVSDLGRFEGADGGYVERAGLDLLTRLRARDSRVKVIFCTSSRAATQYRTAALSSGALEVIDDCGKILGFLFAR
jgi:hypothetical protein